MARIPKQPPTPTGHRHVQHQTKHSVQPQTKHDHFKSHFLPVTLQLAQNVSHVPFSWAEPSPDRVLMMDRRPVRRVCTALITRLTHFENKSVVRFYNSRDKTALCVGQKGSFQPTKDAAPDETQGQTSDSLWSKQVNWPFNIKHLLCVSHCARSEALLRRKNSPKRSPWQHLPYIFIGRKT